MGRQLVGVMSRIAPSQITAMTCKFAVAGIKQSCVIALQNGSIPRDQFVSGFRVLLDAHHPAFRPLDPQMFGVTPQIHRDPGRIDASLDGQILYGASPRASMGIDRAARAHAWLNGRDYVGPEDIQAVAFDVLRHRLVLSFEAEADGVTANAVIESLLDGVGVP